VHVTDREVEIAAEIRRIAREDLGLDAALGDREALAGRLDSLALLSLVVAVEDRYRFRLTEEDARGATCLADLARVIAAKTPAPASVAADAAP
jgi:acyl carrier protein